MTAMEFDVRSKVVPNHGHRLLVEVDNLTNWWSEFGMTDECPKETLLFRLHELRSDLVRYLARTRCCAGAVDQDHQCRTQGTETADAVLLADLDQLLMRLRSCQPGMGCWSEASAAITAFFQSLRARLRKPCR